MIQKSFLIIFLFLVMLSPSIIAEEAVCEEQLDICLEAYNNIREDFQNEVNCEYGPAFNFLKNSNKVLNFELESCSKELSELQIYRRGFYVILFVLFIIAVGLICTSLKERKLNKGIKNGRKKGKR